MPPAAGRKKKARKYLFVATARRPTAASVCEAYFSRTPSKVGFLRVDALALLLSMANVGAHARVLVLEVSARATHVAPAAGWLSWCWRGSLACGHRRNSQCAQLCAALR